MYTINLSQDQEEDLLLFLNRYKMKSDLQEVYNLARDSLKYGGDRVQILEQIKEITQDYWTTPPYGGVLFCMEKTQHYHLKKIGLECAKKMCYNSVVKRSLIKTTQPAAAGQWSG